jgi:FAD/FMN-containing dehydrogenase/uncharacterized membrane protein YhaH (DUF805 family)
MSMQSLRQKIPLTYMLFTRRGRIGRLEYLHCLLLLAGAFYLLNQGLGRIHADLTPWLLTPVLLWSLISTSTKRLHDVGRGGWWLVAILIPVLGLFWLGWQLLARSGRPVANPFGAARGLSDDYLRNDQGQPAAGGHGFVINEVSQLHPIVVAKVERPTTVEALRQILITTSGPISVGGGRFSMGGQTASPGSLHLDLRGLNAIVDFSREQKWIRVQAGTRWCDIQRHIDPHGLSVKIMQTYANFTVGGTLSVNAHGRYIGFGPAVLSVRRIDVMLADGSVRRASRTENPEIFFAAIGGYGAIGIITEAELDLADNTSIECFNRKLVRTDYAAHFKSDVRDDPLAVLHNGDMYPPDYRRINAVTWRKTERTPTTPTRLMPLNDAYPVMRYFIWAYSETPGGHWRREYMFDPVFFFRNRVYWRNYEAGYDVAELEPKSRHDDTYVLQEYFIPVRHFDTYANTLTEILKRHHVNILNISIRHALPDPGTLLSWAREEVFAFVIYHKQEATPSARGAVAVWTRELIEAAIALGGTYYLPYQVHATQAQFHLAYPRARELFALKRRLDPDYRLRHVLWNSYYSHPNDQTSL